MNPKSTSDDVYVICPHCGEKHGDAWEWCDENPAETVCENEECGKEFICWAAYEVTYHAEAKDVAEKENKLE